MNLPLKNLRYQNPCIDFAQLRRWGLIYQGESAVRRNIGDFIPKEPLEPEAVYQKRTVAAADCYENHLANIIANFDAQLFAYPFDIRAFDASKAPYEDADSLFATFKERCTPTGQDLQDFMRNRFVDSLIYGSSYFVLHLREGIPSLEAINTPDLIDYHYNEDGFLDYAIVKQCSEQRASFDSLDLVVSETFRIFLADRIDTYRLEYPKGKEPKEDAPVPLVASEPHPFGIPPLIALTLPNQLAIVPRAGNLQVQYFRLAFGYFYALKRTNFPLPVYYSLDPEDKTKQPSLRQNGVTISVEEKFEWMTPDPGSFEAQNESLRRLKDEIYRISNAGALSIDQHLNGSVARSGESKQLDAASFEITLTRYGAIIRECVQSLYQLISFGLGKDLEWSVTGLERFAVAVKGAPIQDDILLLETLGAASKTARVEILALLAEKGLPSLPQRTKFDIRLELEESANDPLPNESQNIAQSDARLPSETTPEDKGEPKNL